jgi:2-polyprenyl-6-hydroxyphenyl methylase/3-demethylubiquinone-9 3-methyltransferase
MKNIDLISGYHFGNSKLDKLHLLLLPVVLEALEKLNLPADKKFIFDLGCGNGSVANFISCKGWIVTGVDPSIDGIKQANTAFPSLNLQRGSAYENLSKKYGKFPALISIEVIEHLYDPRLYLKTVFDLLIPGGTVIISTPYHGFWKNLVMALFGKMDNHFHALWDHGHIKFWSKKTLKILLSESGFVNIKFKTVGRVSIIAKF